MRIKDIRTTRAGDMRVAFTSEFSDLDGRKNVIREFIKFRERKEPERNKIYEADGLVIQELKPNRGGLHKELWRIDYNGKSFFVKETDDTSAMAELFSLSKLSKLKFSGVEVIKYYASFSRGDSSFMVTEYRDLPLLYNVNQTEIPEKIKRGFCRFKFAAGWLFSITDIRPHNAFYDQEKKRIIVFDPLKLTRREFLESV